MSKTVNVTHGLGFTQALTLIFIVAKLWGKIDWPWIWVISPLWIVGSIVGIVLLLAGIVWLTFTIINKLDERKWDKEWKQKKQRYS